MPKLEIKKSKKEDTRFYNTMFQEANKFFFGKEEITQSAIVLSGEINDETCTDVMTEIIGANFSPIDERPDVINLILRSPGGALDPAISLVSAIRASKIPVRTVALGSVGSAAFLILMSGKQRMADPYCTLLSHQFSAGSKGTYNDLSVAHKQMIETHKLLCRMYHDFTGLPIKTVEKKLLKHEDVWLTPEKALKFNAIDLINTMD